jgi:hypothetical protein
LKWLPYQSERIGHVNTLGVDLVMSAINFYQTQYTVGKKDADDCESGSQKVVDNYDIVSFLYGLIYTIQENTTLYDQDGNILDHDPESESYT